MQCPNSSTDEDARQAMMNDGGKIKEMKIKLLLSSRTEMQKVIETARQQTLSLQSFMQNSAVPVQQSVVTPKPVSPPEKREKERDNDSESSKDRRDKRERTRSRDRSRSRDRDRDRDRRDRDRGRDRRRRDRSRSRDRDRRDRRRRRDRSRSRDRTRSRDRDSKRNAGGDRRKDNNDDDISEVVIVGQFPKDKAGPGGPAKGGKKLGLPDNGVWEVPPQNQMQTVMLAPGILGAGVAALAQDTESRSLPFGAPVALGQQPMLQSNQFALNGLNGVGGLVPPPHVPGVAHGLGMNPAMPPSLAGALPNIAAPPLGALGRSREPWGQGDTSQRLDAMRFPSRSSPFGGQDSYGGFNASANSNSTGLNYRPGGLRPNHPHLMNKMQELEGRRNPHAFQTNMGGQHYDGYGGNGPEGRQKTGRNSGSRFSSDNSGSNSQSSDGNCIEVRNMPLDVSYSDVRHAFQGLYIRKDGLKLINDTHGNRVGIAYIKFSKPEGKDAALSMARYVRGSEVEVLHLDESIFDKAIDSFNPDRDNREGRDKERERSTDSSNDQLNAPDSRTTTCILIPDLPSFAKEMDIAKLFHDWKINDLFITSNKDSTGTSKYMAYVQFARIEDAKSSLSIPLKIGPKGVTATPIGEEKFMQAKRIHEQTSMNDSSSCDCVLVRGLPFQSINRDVLDYFSDLGLVPHRIHMMLNQNGKPSGKCFCEFDTPEEAVRALGKNGIPMGKHMPTVELVSRSVMMEALSIADANLMEAQHQQHYPPGQEPRPRFSPMPNHPPRFGNGGGFGGPPRGGPPPGMMGMPRHMGMNRHPPSMDYVEGFGKPGCVLSLENVPFKADIDEIIEFFRDFDVKRENVIRRYNDKGMPTGDARVAFVSPNEAQRALRELRHCKVRDRTIFMKIA